MRLVEHMNVAEASLHSHVGVGQWRRLRSTGATPRRAHSLKPYGAIIQISAGTSKGEFTLELKCPEGIDHFLPNQTATSKNGCEAGS